MRTNIKQQFINRLLETKEPFSATFQDRRISLNQSERITFERVGIDWYANIERTHTLLCVGKYTANSVHLYRHIAGCKLSVIIPLSQLLHIQPIQQ
ncbi:MAG: hypothetical protein BGO59_00215 [Spirosoma sp. 48-14]|nr:MAG: hypothetical protein BGO59_00215 [Spirosoma sp. 48-14]